jgi:hypothetical protein
MLGRRVIPIEEMVQKIKAAADAREDQDFVIIARTDARTNHGLDEALRRGKAYAEAGADVLFIESPESVDELRRINEAFPSTPTLANMIEGGRTPFLPAAELEALGFGIALYPTGPLYAAAKAVKGYVEELKTAGTTAGKARDMIAFEEFNRLIGLPEVQPPRGAVRGRIATASSATAGLRCVRCGFPGRGTAGLFAPGPPAVPETVKGTLRSALSGSADERRRSASDRLGRQKPPFRFRPNYAVECEPRRLRLCPLTRWSRHAGGVPSTAASRPRRRFLI